MGTWFIMEGMTPAGPGWTGISSGILLTGAAFAAACVIILSGVACTGSALGIACIGDISGAANVGALPGTILTGDILGAVFSGDALGAVFAGEVFEVFWAGNISGAAFICCFGPRCGIVPPGTAFVISFFTSSFSYNDSSGSGYTSVSLYESYNIV